MAEGSSEIDKKTECEMAIAYVSDQLAIEYTQYPNFADLLKLQCAEEAFEDIEVLMDDVAEGFDESVILEAITDEIDIEEGDKEVLCNKMYSLLSTFVPRRPEPSSLNLAQLHTNYNENDMQNIKKLVSLQAKLLEPNNADTSIYKVLIIGEKNHLPLLSYLVDTYNRCRLTVYFEEKLKFVKKENSYDNNDGKRATQFIAKNALEILKLEDFCATCPTMKKLAVDSPNVLLSYKAAMKSCIHRNGLFYCLPLIQENTSKINDSVHVFCLYSISILKATNDLIKKKSLKHFPLQIDIWIIPKNIKESHVFDDDNSSDDDDDEKANDDEDNFDIYHGLHQCDNVQKIRVTPDIYNMHKLCAIFCDLLENTLEQQTRKRMILIIDRRERKDDNNKDQDIIYAYLPPNTQNIPQLSGSGYQYRHLYESMANLTKSEILPSYDEDGELDENTINANSGFMNMFVLSLHLHNERDIALYWHYSGSCNRFCVMDMMCLWPLLFITAAAADEMQDAENDCIENYILNAHNFDQLIDVNFRSFYERNTQELWHDTAAPSFRAKPTIIAKRRNSDQERLDTFDKWKKIHAKEEKYRAKHEMRKQIQMKRAKTGLWDDRNRCKKTKTEKRLTFTITEHEEGEIKHDPDSPPFEIEEEEEEEKKYDELRFIYEQDFDKNGLLYFLGSYARRKIYENPAGEIRQFVDVTLSSLANDSKSEMYFVGRECVRCMTNNNKPSFMKVNLRSIAIKLSHYTLKHHNSHNVALTNWTLEGSNDGNNWMILKNHVFDKSLKKPGDTKTWRIDTDKNDYFTQFRIYMTDVNNSGRWYLGCSGIELYGSAFGGLVSESLRADFDEKLQLLEAKENNLNVANADSFKISVKSHSHLSLNDSNKASSPLMRTVKSLGNLPVLPSFRSKSSKRSLNEQATGINNIRIQWNVYPKAYKKCIQNKRKTICRNDELQCDLFLCGSSSYGMNDGCCEFKIKYESIHKRHKYCNDVIGIISNVEQCRSDQSVNSCSVYGMYYSYWCGGAIHSVLNGSRNIINVPTKLKSGQVLTVRVHCYLNKSSFINFFIDDKKISNDIPIKYDQNTTYYPVIGTQTSDTKLTVV